MFNSYKVLKLQRAVNVYNFKAVESSEYLQCRDRVVITKVVKGIKHCKE